MLPGDKKYSVRVYWRFAACVTFFFFTHLHFAIAQGSHQIFEHLTTDHGLSSNKVEAVLQDREGFYWIATQNGLNKYDGTTFTIYRHKADDSTSLTHNYCTTLLEDKNGDIWVATYKGVSRFIKSKGHFQPVFLHNPSKNFEITNRIQNLALDKAGNVWIAGNGLWRYDIETGKLTFHCREGNNPSFLPLTAYIIHFVYDSMYNGLWMSTGTNVGFYSIDKDEFHHRAYNPQQWKVFDAATSAELTLDRTNRLWFRDEISQTTSFFETDKNQITSTGKKVMSGIKHIIADDKNRIWIFYWTAPTEIYDPVTGLSNKDFFTIRHRHSVLSERAVSLFIDAQGNYWIPSNNGISIYNERNQYYKLHQLDSKNAAFENAFITAIAQDNPKDLWVATNVGLFKYSFQDGHYRVISVPDSLARIRALFVDGKYLWMAVGDRLKCLDIEKEVLIKTIILKPSVYFILKGMDNDLWVGLWNGGLFHIDLTTMDTIHFKKVAGNANTLKSNNLITGHVDQDKLWIGYNGGQGFSEYSLSSKTFRHFHPQQYDQSSANAGTTTVITKDPNGWLWLGTHGSGIIRYDQITQTFMHLQQHEGLSSNYINSILPDKNGNLWISTADGMNYYYAKQKSIRKLEIDLVFPDNDLEPNGLYGKDDKLFFFCKNEFVEINPAVYRPDSIFPHLVLSSFKIFDREIPVSSRQERINLTYRENFFSFDFSTIKTHPSRDVHYAYMLEGFDKDWIINGRQNQASYTNVPDGNYIFKVKATNDQGQWSDPLLNLAIHIKPPFWRTWWFILLGIVAISSAVYAFYQYRIQQIKKIFSVRTKISQDLHDDIGGSLSSINIYSEVAEKEMDDHPDKAREFLQQINVNSREVMENISDIVWANNTGRQETTLASRIKNYGYDLLAQKNIECRYVVEPSAEKRLSDPEARRNILLIIKEALNNIAKYSAASHVEIRVSLNGTNLLIDITDNGKGFDPDHIRQGNGLYNMKRRAEILGGQFSIHSSPGDGTAIHCKVPITNISDK